MSKNHSSRAFLLPKIINLKKLQGLLDLLYQASGIPSGVVSVDGEILAGAGWQKVCTDFHRANKTTCQRCKESDTYLASEMLKTHSAKQFTYTQYKCGNGLWDCAIPIFIDGQHTANYFLGQFFYDDEVIDEEFFANQAKECGFDEKEYLKAVREVPRFSKPKVEAILRLNQSLVETLSELGNNNLALEELKTSLEEKVEARTSELKTLNKELHHREVQLQNEKKLADSILNSLPNLFYLFDSEMRLVRWNDNFQQTSGYDSNELFGRHALEFIAPHAHQVVGDAIQRVFSTGEANVESYFQTKQGNPIPCIFTGTRLAIEDKPHLVGGGIDITDRKEAEKTVKETKDQFLRLFMEVSIPLCFVNRDGRLIHINNRFTRLFGYTLQDVPTLEKWWLHAYPDKTYRQWAQTTWETAVKKAMRDNEDIKPVEYYVACKNGGVKPILIGGVTFGEDFLATFVDLSKIKEYEEELKASKMDLKKKNNELDELNKSLEERVKTETAKNMKHESLLMQQSKMAAMGEMIGAIAHQWRQPLNALGLIIQDIQDAYDEGELDREYVNDAVKKSMGQIQFMSDTINDFRGFFKPKKEKCHFNAGDAIGKVISLLKSQMVHHNIQVKQNIPAQEKEVSVYGYPNEFEQAIVNILGNAREAISEKAEGGKLYSITINCVVEKDVIIIEIEDEGGGIPQKQLERVFEPYFTTKEEGKGTGIGLYMTKLIIEDHMRGKLTARNGEKGAIFTITLERKPPHT